MRGKARSFWVGFLALLGAVVVAISSTAAAAIQLQAATALIMGGTQHPLIGPTDQPPFVTAYLNNAIDSYIDPAAAAGTGTVGPATNAVAVYGPEEFFPVFGSRTFDQSTAIGLENLHNCLNASGCVYNNDPAVDPEVGTAAPVATDKFIVFGYSQSAVVAALAKRDLIDDYHAGDPSTSFLLVADPMRPNGGILMRFKGVPTIPLLGITFWGAAPTNSAVLNDNGTPSDPSDDTYVYPTVDVAQQYDALGGDFPVRPLNLLATINALAAYLYLHGNVVNKPLSEALYQGKVGDTSYYMFPTDTLPVLMPLEQLGVPKPILGLLDAPLRVLIEDAYARNVSPGTPTGASILPIGNPIALALHLLASIPVGIDNALQDLGVGRVLGTTDPGPFGVGGPALPSAETAVRTATALSPSARMATAVGDSTTESFAPRSHSAKVDTHAAEDESQVAASEPTTGDSNAAVAAPADANPTTTPSASGTTNTQADDATPKANNTPPAREPRPKVRFPIEFNSHKKPTESPSSPTREKSATGGQSITHEQSTTKPSAHEANSSSASGSPGSENKEAA